MANKSYIFKLIPSTEQLESLNQHGGAVRWIWNHMLQQNITRYENEKKFIFGYQQHALLPELKKEYDWLKNINSQSLQAKCMDLDKTIKHKIANKKNKTGFPKFKKKSDNKDSFRVPQAFKLSNKGLYLPKIGWVKWKIDRKIKGKVKSITIKQDSHHWMAVVLVEVPDIPTRNSFAQSEIVGIDLGIKSFTTLSNGDTIANPRHLEKSSKLLSKKQKELSRKIKGSSNRNKAKSKVSKLHRHVRNQRSDFQWKLANSITKDYAVICMETLNIKGMMKNRKLSKSISSAGWYSFKTKLSHKLTDIGGILIDIDQFAPSTKMCSSCGALNNNLSLSVREWDCICGAHHDRDINAAINIRSFGINRLGTSRIYACGDISNKDIAYDMSSYVSLNQEKMVIGPNVTEVTVQPTVNGNGPKGGVL